MAKNQNKSLRSVLASKYGKQVNDLTNKEFDYFKIIQARSGVLYTKGRPGEAKSAIYRSIARKMGWRFVDLRLSQVDETEVGIFPKVKDNYFEHIPPRWAYDANESPVLICFEELNRARLEVRNAALQILNEREVGSVKFNDNVFMCASGNLGDEDNTDVEELDAAIKNRLITKKHNLTLKDWKEGYANENVHPTILQFLTAEGSFFYTKPDSNQDAFASARSWANLSSYITSMFSKEDGPQEWLEPLRDDFSNYVGDKAGLAFFKWVQTTLKMTLDDIIDNFDSKKDDLDKVDNSIKSDLLNTLSKRVLTKYNQKQIDNIIKFINILSKDERTGYFRKLVDDDANEYLYKGEGLKIMTQFNKHFKAELSVIQNSTTQK